MPKGVEHWVFPHGQDIRVLVIIPLMPKGVEHHTDEQRRAFYGIVIIPLMPKGVEHLFFIASRHKINCDHSIDAERR